MSEPEYAPGTEIGSDAEIKAWISRNVDSNYHLSGSCRVGIDDGAVVDPQLRVRGIKGLRIVDATVMPAVISGNTNAATMMVAEKGVDFILRN